jgi:cytochrome bd-type quinol oxidase subunit 2
MSTSEAVPERKLLPSMFSHISGFLALGAVLLYSLGVVKTIGHLRASHVDQTEGLSLISLDRHLRNAVGIITTPAFIVAVLYTVTQGWSSYTMGSVFRDSDEYSKGDRVVAIAITTFVCVVGLVTLATGPWPSMLLFPLLGVIIAILEIAKRHARKVTSNPLWRDQWSNFVLALFTVFLILGEGGYVYFHSDPLPEAHIRKADGALVIGPLITTNDGMIYVGARGKTLYRQVPISRTIRINVIKQKRKAEQSILELVGLK